MEFVRSVSSNISDYEIMIRRRGEREYSAYCPQLNFMLYGYDYDDVKKRLSDYIEFYVNSLKQGIEVEEIRDNNNSETTT